MKVKFSLGDDLVVKARSIFEKRLKEQPFAELASEKWLRCCEFPIGISGKEEPFPLE